MPIVWRRRRFRDRVEAGQRLAGRLGQLAGERPVVLGLPRGGVPVAAEVARALAAPLDVLIVRKLGHPFRPELAIGALGEGGVTVINEDLAHRLEVTPSQIETAKRRESAELERRVAQFRTGRAPMDVTGRVVIVVDDGLATGSTARAAIAVLRARGAGRIILAVPVAPADVCRDLRVVADDVIALATPSPFGAVGAFYDDFHQVPDAEVLQILDAASAMNLSIDSMRPSSPPRATGSSST